MILLPNMVLGGNKIKYFEWKNDYHEKDKKEIENCHFEIGQNFSWQFLVVPMLPSL